VPNPLSAVRTAVSGNIMLRRGGFISTIVALCCALWALPAFGKTQVLVMSGTGDLGLWNSSTKVEKRVPLSFEWWTDEANTTGVQWKVYVPGNPAPIAHGQLTISPTQTQPYSFILPADTFLASNATSTPVIYTLTVTALHANGPGTESPPVTITEALFGNADVSAIGSKPPFVQPPEPGHPVATLIAYRPIGVTNVAGVYEGMITLEFSNPSSSATAPGTDPVTVTVADLNQVLQQTAIDVVVPSLPTNEGGNAFRVAIALGRYQIIGDAPDGTSWRARSEKGISLLVGTAKLQSPYVQYQQPPILTGATSKCAFQACAPASPPWIANFRPANLTNSLDFDIAAGQDFLYAGNYNLYEVYAKMDTSEVDLPPVDLTNTQLFASSAPGSPSQLAVLGGGAPNLFRAFWFFPGAGRLAPQNLNVGMPNSPIPCVPTNPVALDKDTHQPASGQNGFPATSCIKQFYDGRLTYDDERRRFWIVSHSSNSFPAYVPGQTPPSTSTACQGLSQKDCQDRIAEGAWRLLAAVSNGENPAAGFQTSLVDSLVSDWPVMGVHGRYVLFSYNGPYNSAGQSSIRLYDADSVAKGAPVELLSSLNVSDFGAHYSDHNAFIRLPKHRQIGPNIAFIVATEGPVLRLYAFNSPTGPPKLLGPATYTDPADSFDSSNSRYESVVRGNYLYMVTCQSVVAGSGPPPLCSYNPPNPQPPGFNERVIVWRIPFSLSPPRLVSVQKGKGEGHRLNAGTVAIDSAHVQKWILEDKKLKLDNPTIEVTKNNDVVVSFRAWDQGVPNQVWYDVLYWGESSFRHSTVLSAPATGASGGARIDYISSSIDPTDDETVWIIGKDGNGPIVASVRP
jgi:hypothetical protein